MEGEDGGEQGGRENKSDRFVQRVCAGKKGEREIRSQKGRKRKCRYENKEREGGIRKVGEKGTKKIKKKKMKGKT